MACGGRYGERVGRTGPARQPQAGNHRQSHSRRRRCGRRGQPLLADGARASRRRAALPLSSGSGLRRRLLWCARARSSRRLGICLDRAALRPHACAAPQRAQAAPHGDERHDHDGRAQRHRCESCGTGRQGLGVERCRAERLAGDVHRRFRRPHPGRRRLRVRALHVLRGPHRCAGRHRRRHRHHARAHDRAVAGADDGADDGAVARADD